MGHPATGIGNWTSKVVTEQFTFMHEQLRTLNSVPIALVTPPTPTSIVVPLFVYQFVTAGGVAFSSTLHISLNMDVTGSAFTVPFPESITGLAVRAVAWNAEGDIFAPGLNYISASVVGSPFFLVGDADVTGGDGTVLTLRLTYEIVETHGLI